VHASPSSALDGRRNHLRDAAAESYEELVVACAEQFTRYLRRLLDRSAEGRGGRVGVEDTLQDALVRIYDRWPELSGLPEGERERIMYRCLRDAAARALRQEYGSRQRSAPRPRQIAYDFAALEVGDEERPVRERELTAAVLGGMVRELAGDDASAPVLGRAVLLAGLRALTEHEAVVVIAVDHLGWDQERLAEHLGVGFSTMRRTLRVGRTLLAMTIRHAAGIEVDDHEQAQLAAFRAGELKGADRGAVARHLRSCRACQTLDAQRQGFGHGAVQVLVPLPVLAAGEVLVKGSVIKSVPAGGASGGGGGGVGLFAQPGAAKVTAAVMSLLIAGGGTAAVLAAISQRHGHQPRPLAVTTTTASGGFPPPGGMRRIDPPPVAHHQPAKPHRKHRATSKKKKSAPSPAAGARGATTPQTATTPQATATAPPASQNRTPSTSSGSSTPSGSSCEFFCG
jgi:DNA-directed RNA polymerase specialized sigma24 family protein